LIFEKIKGILSVPYGLKNMVISQHKVGLAHLQGTLQENKKKLTSWGK